MPAGRYFEKVIKTRNRLYGPDRFSILTSLLRFSEDTVPDDGY
jgi:hypothetical protein